MLRAPTHSLCQHATEPGRRARPLRLTRHRLCEVGPNATGGFRQRGPGTSLSLSLLTGQAYTTDHQREPPKLLRSATHSSRHQSRACPVVIVRGVVAERNTFASFLGKGDRTGAAVMCTTRVKSGA